jgi:hypothetical protein
MATKHNGTIHGLRLVTDLFWGALDDERAQGCGR